MSAQNTAKERPIIFSSKMVKAILDNRKTQTRRVVKPQPGSDKERAHNFDNGAWGFFQRGFSDGVWALEGKGWFCPYGKPGDRLWVREAFCFGDDFNGHEAIYFRADNPGGEYVWKPSIFMSRSLSRITLEITGVRVERMQEISESDAQAEGINLNGFRSGFDGIAGREHRIEFARLWDSINGKKHPWASNPFVWVIEFKRVGAE